MADVPVLLPSCSDRVTTSLDLLVPDTEGWHGLSCTCGSDLGSLPCLGLGTPRDFTFLHPDATRWVSLLLQRRKLRLRKAVKGRAGCRTSQDPGFWPQRYLLSHSLLEGPGSWLGSVNLQTCVHMYVMRADLNSLPA